MIKNLISKLRGIETITAELLAKRWADKYPTIAKKAGEVYAFLAANEIGTIQELHRLLPDDDIWASRPAWRQILRNTFRMIDDFHHSINLLLAISRDYTSFPVLNSFADYHASVLQLAAENQAVLEQDLPTLADPSPISADLWKTITKAIAPKNLARGDKLAHDDGVALVTELLKCMSSEG